MGCVGIVAEYNPFHNGHRHHIAEAKRAAGADTCLVVMSADFVQRGEPAVADKFTRARWALQHGADMVIELPEVFSCACAERFASGAVRLLAGTGLVDSICFGSECGDISLLEKAAESEIDPALLRDGLAAGNSYPKAMAMARGAELGPNDLLGTEYIRAIKKYAPHIKAFTVRRIGDYDDGDMSGEFSSAAAIRRALAPTADVQRMSARLFDSLNAALPRRVLTELSELIHDGLCPASSSMLSDAVISRLRRMSAEEIAALPEVSEGLENLFARCSGAGDTAEMLAGVKSKRYTMARLKRISICALLGVTEELQSAVAFDDSYLYARVLGIREGRRELISKLVSSAKIPVLTQAAERERLCENAKRVLNVSALAHRLYSLARPYERAADDDAAHRLEEVSPAE